MPDPTHIVFVHVDQLTWQAISANGNQSVHTPNIDRIIADGTSFDASYSATPISLGMRPVYQEERAGQQMGVAA